MIIHSCLNSSEVLGKKKLHKIYEVDFEFNFGYWSKRYLAVDSKHAKSMMQEEYPSGLYKRSKIRK